MSKMLLFVLATATVFGADDPWDKVKDLKTGVELRIYKHGARQPMLATMDEADAERVVVVVKKEEVAIPKADIDRIDFRPATKGGRIAKTTTTTEAQTHDPVVAMTPQSTVGPGASTSTNTSFGSAPKPDFETIYRRVAGAPH